MPTSQKEPDHITWRIINNTLLSGKHRPKSENPLNSENRPERRKIAAFDFVSFYQCVMQK